MRNSAGRLGIQTASSSDMPPARAETGRYLGPGERAAAPWGGTRMNPMAAAGHLRTKARVVSGLRAGVP